MDTVGAQDEIGTADNEIEIAVGVDICRSETPRIVTHMGQRWVEEARLAAGLPVVPEQRDRVVGAGNVPIVRGDDIGESIAGEVADDKIDRALARREASGGA